MKYKGIEVKKFTSDKPVVFDPPKKMWCWDFDSSEPREDEVYAYMPNHPHGVIGLNSYWRSCGELTATAPTTKELEIQERQLESMERIAKMLEMLNREADVFQKRNHLER